MSDDREKKHFKNSNVFRCVGGWRETCNGMQDNRSNDVKKNEVTNMDVIDSSLARFPRRPDGGKSFHGIDQQKPTGTPMVQQGFF